MNGYEFEITDQAGRKCRYTKWAESELEAQLDLQFMIGSWKEIDLVQVIPDRRRVSRQREARL